MATKRNRPTQHKKPAKDNTAPRRALDINPCGGLCVAGSNANSPGSIRACMTTTIQDDDYSVAIYNQAPGGSPAPRPIGSATLHLSNGSFCTWLPAGTATSPNNRWIQWMDESAHSGSVVPFVATNCVAACPMCHPHEPPVPVTVCFQIKPPLNGGPSGALSQLNARTELTHSHDPQFSCNWFSRALDLDDDSGNPAFWMLQRTKERWLLILRRVSNKLAEYHLDVPAKADMAKKDKPLSLTVKRGWVFKEFKNWPATITIHGA